MQAALPSLHPLHRIWRAFPPKARRRLLAHGTALLAPRPDRPPPGARGGVAVGGEIGRASGLGEGARLMLRGLEQLGIPCWPVAAGLTVPGDSAEASGRAAPPPPGAPLLLHVNGPQVPWALLRLGRRFLRGRQVIGHWAWELPVVSPDWRRGLPFVHEVWAPSRFTAAAFEPLLPGRVRRVPYPVAASPPRPAPLDRAAFGLPAGAVITFVSFSLASSFERKNPLGAIAAHRAAFGDRADRVLLLKVAQGDHYPDDMRRLAEAAAAAPNVRLETRLLPAADAHALTACADIVLSLHRSEGFGLVPAEAMLLGRPVVATAWSGNMDFMDEASAALVPFRLIPARDPRGVFEAEGALWADPDAGAAAARLRQLADDPGSRAALGGRGRARAEASLGTAPLAAALAAIGLPCGC